MKDPENPSIVTGILYQNKGSTDTQLVGGLANSIKLFDDVPITGFTYREENAIEDKLVSGLQVTGIVHRSGADLDEQILRSEKIKGVIFQNRGVAKGDKAGGPENVDPSREISSLPQQGPLSGSQIVGIVCRDQGTGEERLTTGARADLKILNGAAIAGIIFEGTEGEVIKRLHGSNITGLLFQQKNSSSETLIGNLVLLGFIYREKGAPFKILANSSQNAVSMIKSSVLYVILIVGVLGLLLPAVRQENDFSPLNFLGLPSTVVTTLLVLMVVVPIIILIYEMYGRSRTISPL
jgi:hypothetical protein